MHATDTRTIDTRTVGTSPNSSEERSDFADASTIQRSGAATLSKEELAAFGAEIDEVRKDIHARLGEDDVAYMRDIMKVSKAAEVAGRGMLHAGKKPGSFLAGVALLWLHKQLEATEIGHTVLHGAYNSLPDNDGLSSDGYYWHVPINEEGWKMGHNVKHHRHTNHYGMDPDMEFGMARLSDRVPWKPINMVALPFTLLALFPGFGFWMNWHFTGLSDIVTSDKRHLNVLPDLSNESKKKAITDAFGTYKEYYSREYVMFPAMAGKRWHRVLAGNVISEGLRNIYSAATIFCGHVGEDIADYEEGDRPPSRAAWYARQVESANNFDVSLPVSILCGGLDCQIEHHLFPQLPPNRLREIQPRVQEICEKHGVRYQRRSWGATLMDAFRKIARLTRSTDGGPFSATAAVAADMT